MKGGLLPFHFDNVVEIEVFKRKQMLELGRGKEYRKQMSLKQISCWLKSREVTYTVGSKHLVFSQDN